MVVKTKKAHWTVWERQKPEVLSEQLLMFRQEL